MRFSSRSAGVLVTMFAVLSASVLSSQGSDLDPPFEVYKGLYIGPLDGFTTAWHPAPETMVVPREAEVQLKIEGSVVNWNGANPMAELNGWSYAHCQFEADGTYTVEVEVYRSASRAERYQIELRAMAVDPMEISLSPPKLSIEEPELDPDDFNQSSMDLFFAGSVARLVDLGSNRYRTSAGRQLIFDTQSEPSQFGSLVEWRANGKAIGLGSRASAFSGGPGVFEIEAGPTINPSRAVLETYSVSITSHEPGKDYIKGGEVTEFRAVTDPPGFENDVTWLASTQFGTALPILGSGATFSVFFEDVWSDAGRQWLGVRADDTIFEQDGKAQQGCCYSCTGGLRVCSSPVLRANCNLTWVAGGDCTQANTCGDPCLPDLKWNASGGLTSQSGVD